MVIAWRGGVCLGGVMQASDITLEWLNRVLSPGRPGYISSFRLIDVGAGTGLGGTVLRAILEHPGDLPASVIIKLPVSDPETLEAIRQQGILREVQFYEHLAGQAVIRVPQIHHLEVAGEEFAIVMEDLGELKAPTGELNTLGEYDLKRALVTIARLHARFWNDPAIQETWLRPVVDTDADTRQAHAARLDRAIDWLEVSTHDCEYTLDCARRLRRLARKAPDTAPMMGPQTLVHGDFHSNNLCFHEDELILERSNPPAHRGVAHA